MLCNFIIICNIDIARRISALHLRIELKARYANHHFYRLIKGYDSHRGGIWSRPCPIHTRAVNARLIYPCAQWFSTSVKLLLLSIDCATSSSFNALYDNRGKLLPLSNCFRDKISRRPSLQKIPQRVKHFQSPHCTDSRLRHHQIRQRSRRFPVTPAAVPTANTAISSRQIIFCFI